MKPNFNQLRLRNIIPANVSTLEKVYKIVEKSHKNAINAQLIHMKNNRIPLFLPDYLDLIVFDFITYSGSVQYQRIGCYQDKYQKVSPMPHTLFNYSDEAHNRLISFPQVFQGRK